MELEQIKHKLDKEQYDYFLYLKEIINLPLFFTGSITRYDFIKGKSDFDVEVCSDNVSSTKLILDNLFHQPYKKDKNKIIVLKMNNIPISGYKYYFKNNEKNICFDFCLYKKECRQLLELIHTKNTDIPFMLSGILIIIKYLHYHLNVINNNTYIYLKQKLWFLYNKITVVVLDELKYKTYYDKEYQKMYLI